MACFYLRPLNIFNGALTTYLALNLQRFKSFD
jgi:hypothetical protein